MLCSLHTFVNKLIINILISVKITYVTNAHENPSVILSGKNKLMRNEGINIKSVFEILVMKIVKVI